ncbi:MAG TPA: cell division protein FtsA, partial [Syntrophales bacterium]|nr:cell division protein FtsA [Syntrophales bacterium]
LGAGIVLTGGTAVLEGITELGEQIFHMPVRRGVPHGIGGLTDVVNSPLYATGVGLIMYGLRNRSARSFRTGEGSFFAKLIQRIKRWYSEFF